MHILWRCSLCSVVLIDHCLTTVYQIGDNHGDEEEEVVVKLPEAVTDSLCANFDLVDEVIRTDPSAASEILKVLLDSIGRLDLNALSQEPTVRTL